MTAVSGGSERGAYLYEMVQIRLAYGVAYVRLNDVALICGNG